MKYALIIPDGCADEPQASLSGKTPLQAAATPHMDEIAAAGIIGQSDNVPPSLPSGSDVATMNLFGYDALKYHTGRAPLEAAAQGIELGPHDWAVRCNLVTIQNGTMVSFTAGQIPNKLAAHLIGLMQTEYGDQQWEFDAGVSYRNLLIYRGAAGESPFDDKTTTYPPHDLTDGPVSGHLPSGTGGETLKRFMRSSEELFAEDEQNRARSAAGQLPATSVWLWGQGSGHYGRRSVTGDRPAVGLADCQRARRHRLSGYRLCRQRTRSDFDAGRRRFRRCSRRSE